MQKQFDIIQINEHNYHSVCNKIKINTKMKAGVKYYLN